MICRLRSDQRGIALPVAVMMVVLIGVMGAGLLTFVQTGLNSTLEVNQGQRALKMADAGVQAAKRQLAANATTTNYNGTTNLSLTPPDTESPWSYAGAGQTLSLQGTGTSLSSPQCNQCINVKIRWLQPSTTNSNVRDVNRAPQNASTRDFFRIISEATAGNARRRIEAIYYVEGRDIPRAFYTLGPIIISGTANITNMSMFSRGDVTINGGATFSGTDLSYGNWNVSPFNTTARRSSHPSGSFVTVPGVGRRGPSPIQAEGARTLVCGTTPSARVSPLPLTPPSLS
jgi:Tfp pilus assembly protein PilX